jgi:osmoprotectant transport system ATP-binding protein
MIKLHNISKTFGKTKALHTTSLDIQPQSTTVLIGPSGCGKSTLLRLIIGLIKPDNGNIYVEGEMLSPQNLYSIRHKIGYVIQDGGLFPHLNARENVSLLGTYLGYEKTQIEGRINELCELTKYPVDALDRYPSQISGGQRQRVSLMRALMLDPVILLLDEPLGALDPLIRFELQNDLKEIFKILGKTVVMVTHDIGEAGFFGDKIVLLREGIIIQEGTIGDLVKNPSEAFVTEFIKAQRSPLESINEDTRPK